MWSIYLHLDKLGLLDNMRKIDGELASEKTLKLCHNESYLMKVTAKVGLDTEDPLTTKELKRNKNVYNFQYDTYENKWTQHCAKLSAGCVIEVIDALYTDQIKSAFCIVRPPGHHAHPSTASGF